MSARATGMLGKRVEQVRELAAQPEITDSMRARVLRVCAAIDRGKLSAASSFELYVTMQARISSERRLAEMVARMEEEAEL